jgi:hypothetical protein
MAASTAIDVGRFARQGFLALPGFLDAREVARLRAVCDRVLERQRPAGAPLGDTTNIAYLTDARWHVGDAAGLRVLLEFAAMPRVLTLVTATVGAPLFHNTQYFMEPRARSWPGDWHRDCQFLVDGPEHEDEVRAGTVGVHFRVALVDDDHVEYLPGSHVRGDTALESEVRWRRAGHAADEELPGAQRLALGAGDALLFHAWGIHRGRYQAGRARRSLDVIYDVGGPPDRCPSDGFAEPVPLEGLSAGAQGFFASYNASRRGAAHDR